MPRNNPPPAGYPDLHQLVYTAKEAAQILRCSVKNIYLLSHQGKLNPTSSEGAKRYSRREILRYLNLTEEDLKTPEVA